MVVITNAKSVSLKADVQSMPINPKDVTWITEPEIGFWEATFLPAIMMGLKTTLGHVTDYRPVTQQYPEQKPILPQHYRGVHRLNRDEQGRVKCVACMLCATACPANCIAIEAAPPRQIGPTAISSRPSSYSMSSVASTAVCARRPARSMRSS